MFFLNTSKFSGSASTAITRPFSLSAYGNPLLTSPFPAPSSAGRTRPALVKQRAGESEEAKLLMTIPGVGYFTALAILAEIGDVIRFPNEERLCSYAGLVPSVH